MKGNKDQRPFSEQICPLTIASQEAEICVLFHSPIIYQTPCPVAVFNFTAWRPKAPGSSFALESIDLAASPASVALVGIVNHAGFNIDLPSSVLISIPGSVFFLDPLSVWAWILDRGAGFQMKFVLLGHQDLWVSGNIRECEVLQSETKDISNPTSPAFCRPHQTCVGDCRNPHSSGKEHCVLFL